MRIITKRQILLLHEHLITMFGGIPGVRDDGLLDSAINAPLQSFGGIDFYPTIIDKSVRLGFGLIRNHPFLDGNKRIGTHAMLAQLDLNGVHLEYEPDDLIELIIEVAAGVISMETFHKWIAEHIIKW